MLGRRLWYVTRGEVRVLRIKRTVSGWPSRISRRWASSGDPSLQYQRLDPVEHVLARPEVYLGSMEPVERVLWLPDEQGRLLPEPKAKVSPALAKVFDEILINAADNVQRGGKTTRIQIDVEPLASCVRVYNDGVVPPVIMHTKEKVLVPELIFGTLLTGSNFNDSGARTTGGRHGYGAKLSNIMSKQFVVTIEDKIRKKRYRQIWKDNMRWTSPAEINALDPKSEGGLAVEFIVDVERFGLENLRQTDIYRWMRRRAWDIAACLEHKHVLVYWNGDLVDVSSFKAYAALHGIHPGDESAATRLAHCKAGIWDICLRCATEEEMAIHAPNVSFVNNVSTTRGGTHEVVVLDQLFKYVASQVEGATPSIVKSHALVFIRGSVVVPEFESQSKELLAVKPACLDQSIRNLPKKKLRELCEVSGLIDEIQRSLRSREASKINKVISQAQKKGRKTKLTIPKLEDATLAGNTKGSQCTLILTEGDSAKALAMAGLAVVGRENFGVYPLRGKVLNVRDASERQIVENEEIMALIRILGLRMKADYTKGPLSLRYGRVLVMADQDYDGSHIKGLVINIFDHLWPSLLRRNDFMFSFITPIVKVFKKKSSQPEHVFYSSRDFNEWRGSIPEEDQQSYRVKYYKGLGTSTSAEGREYFSKLKRHEIEFQWKDSDDSEALEMAFRKSRASDRREWLSKAEREEITLSKTRGSLRYADFVNKELIQFSRYDNERSIPCAIDGLKPSQRKVLFACFKKKLTSGEIKVAQLAGYVAEQTAYHHGEASLHATIVKMAQDFVGSNNLPLLEPIGQFGTRLLGGEDAASARYIYTRLSPVARILFPEEDDEVLSNKVDDGIPVEPETYVPIIPLALVNGAKGIGTGWNTELPQFHPQQVIDNVLRLLEGQPMEEMMPWVRGFEGRFEKDSRERIFSVGVAVRVSSQKVKISELPVHRWTESYREVLAQMLETGQILGYDERHTDISVCFEVTLPAKVLDNLTKSSHGLETFFKLKNSVSMTQMNLFDDRGRIKRYNSPLGIIEEFYPVRYRTYQARKANLEQKYARQLTRQKNLLRFINEVISGDLRISGLPLSSIFSLLDSTGFAKVPHLETSPVGRSGFKYLLDVPLWQLSEERVKELSEDTKRLGRELDKLRQQSAADLWRHDLAQLTDYLSRTL